MDTEERNRRAPQELGGVPVGCPGANLGRARVEWTPTSHTTRQTSTCPSFPSRPQPPLVQALLSLALKDEYLADLYHFATKEDTHANYFIHVSPRPDSSHLSSGATEIPCKVVGGKGLRLWPPGGDSASLTSPAPGWG